MINSTTPIAKKINTGAKSSRANFHCHFARLIFKKGKMRYLYFPEIDTYYDVTAEQFFFNDGKKWSNHFELPPIHRWFNPITGYKIYLDYTGEIPWEAGVSFKTKYSSHLMALYNRDAKKTFMIITKSISKT